ncbi:MAG TPA: hypothetical protein EYP10_12205 [Armatimonadetes bacterium]|nr:hypothetical protein [Armatimonadota bacterium]
MIEHSSNSEMDVASDRGIKLALPLGEFCERVLELFTAADLRVRRFSEFYAGVDDPRITEVVFMEPEQVLAAIAEGNFDAGIAPFDAVADKLKQPFYQTALQVRPLGTELVWLVSESGAVEQGRARSLGQVYTLLLGAIEAQGRVLVLLHVSEENLDRVVNVLPALKSPTIAPLYRRTGEPQIYSVQAVVSKEEVNQVILALLEAGATDIIELPITKLLREGQL